MYRSQYNNLSSANRKCSNCSMRKNHDMTDESSSSSSYIRSHHGKDNPSSKQLVCTGNGKCSNCNMRRNHHMTDESSSSSCIRKHHGKANPPSKLLVCRSCAEIDLNKRCDHEFCNRFFSSYNNRRNVPNQSRNCYSNRKNCTHGFMQLPENMYKDKNINCTQPRCFKCKKICPPKAYDLNKTVSFNSRVVDQDNVMIKAKDSHLDVNTERNFQLDNNFGNVDNRYTNEYKSSSDENRNPPYGGCFRNNVQHFFKEITCIGTCGGDARDKAVQENLECVKQGIRNKPLKRFCYKICYCKSEPDFEYSGPFSKSYDKNCKVCCIVDTETGQVLSDKDKNKRCFNDIVGTPCCSESFLVKPPMIAEKKYCKNNEIPEDSNGSQFHLCKDNYNKCSCKKKKISKLLKRKKKHADCEMMCKTCGDKLIPAMKPSQNPHLTKKDFWQYSDKNFHNGIPYGLKLNYKVQGCSNCFGRNSENVELWKRIDDIEKNTYRSGRDHDRKLSYKISELLFKKYDEFCSKVVKCISKQFTFSPINAYEQRTCQCYCCVETENHAQSKTCNPNKKKSNLVFHNSKKKSSTGKKCCCQKSVCKQSANEGNIEYENFAKDKAKNTDESITDINTYPVQISCGKCIVKATTIETSTSYCKCYLKSGIKFNQSKRNVTDKIEFIYPKLPDINDLENENKKIDNLLSETNQNSNNFKKKCICQIQSAAPKEVENSLGDTCQKKTDCCNCCRKTCICQTQSSSSSLVAEAAAKEIENSLSDICQKKTDCFNCCRKTCICQTQLSAAPKKVHNLLSDANQNKTGNSDKECICQTPSSAAVVVIKNLFSETNEMSDNFKKKCICQTQPTSAKEQENSSGDMCQKKTHCCKKKNLCQSCSSSRLRKADKSLCFCSKKSTDNSKKKCLCQMQSSHSTSSDSSSSEEFENEYNYVDPTKRSPFWKKYFGSKK